MGIRIGPAPPLDPRSLPGIRGWYRESVNISAANVTQWNDLTGFGNHINVGGGTSPTIVSADSAIRGKPAIDFTGTQSLLAGPASNTMFSGAYTVFVVYRFDTSNCGAVSVSGRLITAHNSNWILSSRTCGPDTWVAHNSDFNGFPGLIPTVGVWNVHSVRWNPTAAVVESKSQYGLHTAAVAAYTSNATVMTVGGSSWDGRMAEMIICNQYLDDTAMAKVRFYLQSRYGI